MSGTREAVKYYSQGAGEGWHYQQWEGSLRASARKPLSLGDLSIMLGYVEKSIGLQTSLFALFVCRELSYLELGHRQAIT